VRVGDEIRGFVPDGSSTWGGDARVKSGRPQQPRCPRTRVIAAFDVSAATISILPLQARA